MTIQELKYALISGRPVVIEKGHIRTEGTVTAVLLQTERDMIVPRAEVKTTLGGIERHTLNRLNFKDPTGIEKLVNICVSNTTKIHF